MLKALTKTVLNVVFFCFSYFRERKEEIRRGIDLRARYATRSKVWDIQVPRLRDEHWMEEDGPIRKRMEEQLVQEYILRPDGQHLY